jgi:hypothetical protein
MRSPLSADTRDTIWLTPIPVRRAIPVRSERNTNPVAIEVGRGEVYRDCLNVLDSACTSISLKYREPIIPLIEKAQSSRPLIVRPFV